MWWCLLASLKSEEEPVAWPASIRHPTTTRRGSWIVGKETCSFVFKSNLGQNRSDNNKRHVVRAQEPSKLKLGTRSNEIEHLLPSVWLCINTWSKCFIQELSLNRIQTHDLCYTSAMLYHLSYQANWELATLSVHNTPIQTKYKRIYENSYMKIHIWTVENDVKIWLIIAVMHTT